MTPLAATILDYITVGSIFFIFGAWSLILGLRVRYDPIPYFVANYTGWTSAPLAFPYGGICMIGVGIVTIAPLLPTWILQVVSIPSLFSMVVTLSGFYIRFPKSLTPKWYRRALKAGVPRNDPYLMGKFKALNKNTQKELIQIYKDHRNRSKTKPSKRRPRP